MTRTILAIGIISAALAILLVGEAEAQCGCYSSTVRIYVDPFWDWDDCCCCWEYGWWFVPYPYWRPCWKRVITIYYSPCGWYRYVYYDYPCYGCRRVYVEGRWVYRRSVRLERRYSYSDMANDFVRRRGLDNPTIYRTTSSSRNSVSSSFRSTSYSRTTTEQANDNWHRTKSPSSVKYTSYGREENTHRTKTSGRISSSDSQYRTKASKSTTSRISGHSTYKSTGRSRSK